MNSKEIIAYLSIGDLGLSKYCKIREYNVCDKGSVIKSAKKV